jgi:hypothetical protein
VIVCIFVILLLVTRCGSSSDGVGMGSSGGTVPLVAGSPADR